MWSCADASTILAAAFDPRLWDRRHPTLERPPPLGVGEEPRGIKALN